MPTYKKFDGPYWQLSEEVEMLELWEAAHEYARDFYGEKAHTVELDAQSEYDDQGGYYWSLNSVRVYDQAGEPLEPDYSLPEWRSLAKYYDYDLETKWWEEDDFNGEDLVYMSWSEGDMPTPSDGYAKIDISKRPEVKYVHRLYLLEEDDVKADA